MIHRRFCQFCGRLDAVCVALAEIACGQLDFVGFDPIAEVIPQIYGDPCPLLVLWGNQSFGFRIQLGAARQRPAAAKAIGLTLINPFTGRELLRTYRRATGEPLMLSHNREAQHVDITTTNTVLRLHYRTTER